MKTEFCAPTTPETSRPGRATEDLLRECWHTGHMRYGYRPHRIRITRSGRRPHRQRRDTLIDARHQQLPACHTTGISAGLHVLVRLPDTIDATHLAATAAHHGILLQPLDRYRAGPSRGQHSAL